MPFCWNLSLIQILQPLEAFGGKDGCGRLAVNELQSERPTIAQAVRERSWFSRERDYPPDTMDLTALHICSSEIGVVTKGHGDELVEPLQHPVHDTALSCVVIERPIAVREQLGSGLNGWGRRKDNRPVRSTMFWYDTTALRTSAPQKSMSWGGDDSAKIANQSPDEFSVSVPTVCL